MICVVAAPGRDLLAHLLAQVAGELGVGIGERLVLAHQAAQLFLELADAVFIVFDCFCVQSN